KALLDAARDGKTVDVAKYLKYGANVNQQDSKGGWCALWHAAGRGDVETVAVILEQRSGPVDLHLKSNRNGRTPLAVARFNSNDTSYSEARRMRFRQIVKMMQNAGATH
ncbi:unnamed protein product, partial [Meganyctiphanes norvegica]